jgi:hypothetical protein
MRIDMGLFRVTMTKTFIFSEDIVEGYLSDVNRWANKEALAYGVDLKDIIVEKTNMPNTRAGRESIKIIREEHI